MIRQRLGWACAPGPAGGTEGGAGPPNFIIRHSVRPQTFTRSDFGSYIGLRLAVAATRVPATSIS